MTGRWMWTARVSCGVSALLIPLFSSRADHFGWGFFPLIAAIWIQGPCLVAIGVELATLRAGVPGAKRLLLYDLLALLPLAAVAIAFGAEQASYLIGDGTQP